MMMSERKKNFGRIVFLRKKEITTCALTGHVDIGAEVAHVWKRGGAHMAGGARGPRVDGKWRRGCRRRGYQLREGDAGKVVLTLADVGRVGIAGGEGSDGDEGSDGGTIRLKVEEGESMR